MGYGGMTKIGADKGQNCTMRRPAGRKVRFSAGLTRNVRNYPPFWLSPLQGQKRMNSVNNPHHWRFEHSCFGSPPCKGYAKKQLFSSGAQ